MGLHECVCELGHRTTAITGFVHLKERKMLYGMLCLLDVYTDELFYGVHISFELVLEFIYFIYSTTNSMLCAPFAVH